MDFFNIILILILVIFLLWLWSRRHLYLMGYKIPGPWGYPIIGNILDFNPFKDVDEMVWLLLNIMAENKPIVKIWFGPFLTIGICEPQYIKEIINKRLEKGIFYYSMKPVIKDSLLIAPVSKWKNNRKAFNKTFHLDILKAFLIEFEKPCHDTLCKVKQPNQTTIFNIFPYLQEFVLKSAFSTIFYTNNQKDVDIDLIQYSAKNILDITWRRILNMFMVIEPLWYLNPSSWKLNKIYKKVSSHLNKIISERREFLENNINLKIDGKRKPFLDYLIEDNHFSESQKINEFLLMLIASTDTTANTIGFALLMLGMHQEIQTRAYEEVLSFVGPTESIQNEHLSQMDYLDRVIKETMRLFPAIPIINRYIDEDIVLEPYTIPKGAQVCILTFGLHRDPDIWPSPLKFDPDRFLPEEVAKRHPYSYIPFSGGTRNCIGYQYGFKIIKYFLVSFLRRYKVKTPIQSVHEITVGFEIDLKSRIGYPVQLEERT